MSNFALMTDSELFGFFSDLYKDVNGVRPVSGWDRASVVADVVGFVNDELVRVNSTVEGRQAMMLLAERVLHEAGRYKGFFHLSDLDLPKEVKPGIRYYDNGGVNDEHKFDDTDRTRRVQYFI